MPGKKTVLLLHGFLEDRSMWNSVVASINQDCQFIFPDLPGHGSNDAASDSIAGFADDVLAKHIPETENIFIIGHSMGGYVACEIARRIPEKIRGICLFHSSVREDSAERKLDRLRAIESAKQNKDLYVRMVIGSLFNPAQREKFDAEVEQCIFITKRMSVDAICASILAMRNRGDNLQWMKQRSFPLYYFAGDADSRFSKVDMIEEAAALPGSVLHMANGVGHMGHIESLKEVSNFFDRILRAH